jgi:upstream activation factor subunit UAF30
MSDISKEELKKEIAAILKDGDLSSITSKKVRQDIEKKLDIDLSSRRKEVDELVMDYIEKGKSKKNGNVEDDEEEEEEENEEEDEEDDEEEEEVKKPKRSQKKSGGPPAKKYKSGSSDESEDASDGENDDEYSPKKKAAKKPAKRGAAGRKKKGGSDDDSDEDWGKGKKKGGGGAKKAGGAKRGGGGYTKPIKLSPELSALVGENEMPRHEVVKRIWAIIKERNLYDPKNKQFAICDDELLKVFGVKRFRTFGMMKFLKNHFRTD